jgi:hypothetical protein
MGCCRVDWDHGCADEAAGGGRRADLCAVDLASLSVVCVLDGLIRGVSRNTDYVLVPREKVDEAVEALTKDGWKFA